MKKKNMHSRQKGFTLAELLVVIAIMGLFSSICFAAVKEGLKRGRDAKREAEIRNLFTAVKAYEAEHDIYPMPMFGPFPPFTPGYPRCYTSLGIIECPNYFGSEPPESGAWKEGFPTDLPDALISDGYFSSLPIDPKNSGYYHYRYQPSEDAKSLIIKAILERGGIFYISDGPCGEALNCDFNNDSIVDSADFNLLQQCLNNTEDVCKWFDVDSSGTIDSEDQNMCSEYNGTSCKIIF